MTLTPGKHTLQLELGDKNHVPYIDVMLVLLVIFMVTAPLITPSVINLPTVDRANKQPDKPIEIVIKSDDEVQVKKDPSQGTGGASVPMTQIGSIAKAAQNGDDQRPVVISADKSVKYETVVKAMNQLKRAGIERVGLSVQTARNWSEWP